MFIHEYFFKRDITYIQRFTRYAFHCIKNGFKYQYLIVGSNNPYLIKR